MAAFTNELVAKDRKPTEEISDEEAVAVLKRLAKQRKEAAEQFRAGDREELAVREEEELAVIEQYLPKTAGQEEIEKVAIAKRDALGITEKKDMGRLMGAVMKEFAGRADGNDVKQVVDNLLS